MRTRFLDIHFSKKPILKFLPALLVMLAIFLFSAHPSDPVPLSRLEQILYKGGHVIGYALLAVCNWRAFEFHRNQRRIAWLLAVLYAITDEYHQSFVPGRHPSAFDVLVYDNLGACTSLWLAGIWLQQKLPDSESLVVEPENRRSKR